MDLKKWNAIIPLLISVLSIMFNIYQYFDRRGQEEEKSKIQTYYDKKLKDIQIKSDSLNLINKISEMNAKLPGFEFSYFAMNIPTYLNLSKQSNDKINETGLLQDHPLLSAKYYNNNIVNLNSTRVMTLMIKQTGGSRADNVLIGYDSFKLNSQLGFSFQSNIINLLKNLNATNGNFRLGQISPNQSVIIPLFTYDDNSKGSHDSYSIKGTIYIPKYIEFTGNDGTKKKLEIRKMLENPFSITVDIDERG